jgi:hypothetical protein
MSYKSRRLLYKKLEAHRGRPLISYVTSTRPNASGQIAADVIPELRRQLKALPKGTKAIDLLIISNGGDPTVAWRFVSLIRESVVDFSVLVPDAAFSGATLIALGANEIIMHPHGNLGPVDPQVSGLRPKEQGRPGESFRFGAEDLSSFLSFARREVGLTDQSALLEVLKLFCAEVGASPIGVAARSAQLTLSMGEQLLKLHMKTPAEEQKARVITEALNKKFHHHGYPLSRREAREINLNIVDADAKTEPLLSAIWEDVEDELRLREPFSPIGEVASNPACAPLFSPIPQVQIPANLPPAVAQQAYAQVLQQIGVTAVPPTGFKLISAILESSRAAEHCILEGRIFASRAHDLQLNFNVVQEKSGWITI